MSNLWSLAAPIRSAGMPFGQTSGNDRSRSSNPWSGVPNIPYKPFGAGSYEQIPSAYR
jgi:hypothetical protein